MLSLGTCVESFGKAPFAKPSERLGRTRKGAPSGDIRLRRSWIISGVAFAIAFAQAALSQASAAGVRAGDLQVGGSFSFAKPDYGQDNLRGYGFYSSFDFKPNYGVEIDFHQNNAPSPSVIYERSYEVGGRYVRHYSIFNPYARVMYGRGVFNYQFNVANLAYNMGVIGGGVDINVHRHVNVRADYEYQRWFSFRGNLSEDGSSSLSPQLFTIGAAYHFE